MANPRVRIHLDDARHFLLTEREKYDIIISEPSNLYVSGMLNLYTSEFYRIASMRLAKDGVFFQFMHCYQADSRIMRGLLCTVKSVFPEATFWATGEGDAFVIAKNEPFEMEPEAWAGLLKDKALIQDLARIGIDDPWKLLASFLWGPGDVERHTNGAVLCDDDYPYPEFRSPLLQLSTDETMKLIRELRSAAPLRPLPLVRDTSEKRARLGGIFMAYGSYQRARTEYGRAVETGLRLPSVIYSLALCEYYVGEMKEAANALKRLLSLQPDHREARKLLADIEGKLHPAIGTTAANDGR
jgi:tetratricopeptide (TPR) repeat protein